MTVEGDGTIQDFPWMISSVLFRHIAGIVQGLCATVSRRVWACPNSIHSLGINHHHLVARSKSIAVSTMCHQEGWSVARRNAEWNPRLSGLRSLSIVQSQDWRGRPLGRCQSTGRRSVDARSARQWSSEAAARAICPNSLRWRCCISEETGG